MSELDKLFQQMVATLQNDLNDIIQQMQDAVSEKLTPSKTKFQQKKLPWFKHGVGGFLKKLWYGNSPENPSWGKKEHLSLEEYSIITKVAEEASSLIADDFELILNEEIDSNQLFDIKKTVFNTISPFIGKMANVIVKHLYNFKNQISSVVKDSPISDVSPQEKEPEQTKKVEPKTSSEPVDYRGKPRMPFIEPSHERMEEPAKPKETQPEPIRSEPEPIKDIEPPKKLIIPDDSEDEIKNISSEPVKRGRGRPRKHPKKPEFIEREEETYNLHPDDEEEISSSMARELEELQRKSGKNESYVDPKINIIIENLKKGTFEQKKNLFKYLLSK